MVKTGTKRAVILQPGYIPWLGFFDLMHRADVFVIFDDVQYTVRDWRSRNRVKTPSGVTWLTVPVKAKGVREKLIKEVEIDNSQQWQKAHLKTLESNYRRAKYFDEVMAVISGVLGRGHSFLADLDSDLISGINRYLSLETEVLFSSMISSEGKRDDKLLSICAAINATHYLSGNAAREYLREDIFSAKGITVEWHDYRYPYYSQLWLKEQGFISHLSVLDLLFSHGPDSLGVLTGQTVVARPDGVAIRSPDGL